MTTTDCMIMVVKSLFDDTYVVKMNKCFMLEHKWQH